ncbi:MAG TPA: XkdX family protein [Paenibacillus sp.]|jgi:uncharacterized XkdX family phage protein
MDWYKFVKEHFELGNYNEVAVKVYVVKKKITPQQYKDITRFDYVA